MFHRLPVAPEGGGFAFGGHADEQSNESAARLVRRAQFGGKIAFESRADAFAPREQLRRCPQFSAPAPSSVGAAVRKPLHKLLSISAARRAQSVVWDSSRAAATRAGMTAFYLQNVRRSRGARRRSEERVRSRGSRILPRRVVRSFPSASCCAALDRSFPRVCVGFSNPCPISLRGSVALRWGLRERRPCASQ